MKLNRPALQNALEGGAVFMHPGIQGMKPLRFRVKWDTTVTLYDGSNPYGEAGFALELERTRYINSLPSLLGCEESELWIKTWE